MTAKAPSFTVFSLLIVLLAPPLAAIQPECLDAGVHLQRGVPSAIDVAPGGVVWMANGPTISSWDVSTPLASRLLTTIPVSALAIDLEIDQDRLVVLTTAGFEVWNISANPPVRLANRASPGHEEIHFDDSTLVVSGSSLELWDLSGDQPALRFRKAGPIDASALAADRLVTITPGIGLQILSSSSGELKERVPTTGVAIDASRPGVIYLARSNFGLGVISLSSDRPLQLESIRADFPLEGVRVIGSTIYGWGAGGIARFDASDPLHPILVEQISSGASDLTADQSRLYTIQNRVDPFGIESDDGVAFEIRSLASLRDPVHVVTRTSGPITGVGASGKYLLVAASPHLHILDTSTSSSRAVVASLRFEEDFDRVRVRGDRAVLYGGRWVHLVDISDPSTPLRLGSWETLGLAGGSADLAGEYLIEANHASGFHVVDISDPSRPAQVGGLINDGRGQWRRVTGLPGVAYGSVSAGVKIVDIRAPDKPLIVDFIPLGGAREIEAAATPAGDLLFVQDLDTLKIWDVSEPYSPNLASTINIPGIVDFGILGTEAWAITSDGRLYKVAFSIPSQALAEPIASGLLSPTQVAATPYGAAIADRWEVRSVFDPRGSLEAGAPELAVRRIESGTVVIEIPGINPAHVELELTLPGGTSVTRANDARILVDDSGAVSVRSRFIRSCQTGSWSEPIAVSPSRLVTFVGSGTRLVGDSTVSTAVTLRNRSEATAIAELSGSSPLVQIPASVEIPPSSTRSFTVTIDAAALDSSESNIDLFSTAGDSSDEYRLTVSKPPAGPGTAGTTGKILPGVGSTPGARNTNWKSDLHLHCFSPSCSTDLLYFPYGSSAPSIVTLALDHHETLVVADVIGELFSQSNSSGWLDVRTTGDVSAHAWTYNSGSSSGEFGQRIPVAPATGGRITGLSDGDRYRVNVGIVNSSTQPKRLHLSLLSGNIPIATRSFDLEPLQSGQQSLRSALSLESGVENGILAVSSDPGVVVYATRVDQQTGDALFLYPSGVENEMARYRYVIDPVGSTPGANLSFWKTELSLTAAQPTAISVVYLPQAGDSQPATTTLTLGGGETWSVPDLIAELFDTETDAIAAGTLIIGSDQPLSGWARVYNEGPLGTFGQFVPMREETDVAGAMHGIEHTERFRANLGVVETTGLGATAFIDVMDQRGELVGTRTVSIGPLEAFRWNAFLRDLNLEGLTSGSVVVRSSGEGSLQSWVSVVDNLSGDSRFEY
ncbi:MAG: hypothetical protein KY459_09735 [Acidobacteria bacterium]|nr:hypothetical protein [Acidobacteriota bacterium]